MNHLLSGLRTAIRTLTAIPWPGRDAEDFSASLPWFPVAGLLLGTILYGLSLPWRLLPISPWPAGVAAILVAADICLTRGLHLDGLADWADSLGGLFDRERRLAIMKDASLGAFGVLALILAILTKWLAFDRILSFDAAICLVPILTISRAMMVELIATLPYARPGEGMGRPFVVRASNGHRVLAHGTTVGISAAFGPVFLLLFCLAYLETRIFARRCRRSFGGITGDLLGAAGQLVEITLLMGCALMADLLLPMTGWTSFFV